MTTTHLSPVDTMTHLWHEAGLATQAPQRVRLGSAQPVLPSSFAVDSAAQASIAAAALAASEIGRWRNGEELAVSVDAVNAALECIGHFSVDGRAPDKWDKFSGLYRCRDGHVRIHANFAHHRNGALRLLGLPPGTEASRADAEAAALNFSALELEDAAARAGLVIAAVRSARQWEAHPQARALSTLPLWTCERIGDAPPRTLPALPAKARPLTGLRVLDLTRILAGPTCGRVLAAYGADVMLVNSPHLPNIESIADTSRGKLSCHVDLHEAAGRNALQDLVQGADVFVQGYRPGGLATLGFGPLEAAKLHPGIVYVSLSAYGHVGPWSDRRGFDSLVQTATGFNDDERIAAGEVTPRAMPVQILDYATGFLMAFALQATLLRQWREGGSWHVRLSLAQTGSWLRSLGRVDAALAPPKPSLDGHLDIGPSGWGELAAVRHAARFDGLLPGATRPSVRPGTHEACWPGR
jgi:crotonobetainyl-CoA:carnitine CoA-transferase CaiB-like acyl-CoA transferase